MSHRFINAKTILSNTGKKVDPYFGIKYNMNLYRGCQHNCIYCDSRSSCYRLGDLSDILVKANALELLHKELKSKKVKGTIGFGSMNDCYMPAEKELELTRNALKIIIQHKFPIHIITKSNLVLRDIDLLQEISKIHATVTITITCINDELGRIIEPNAPTSSERFEAIKQLRRANIQAGVIMSPLLPFINDSTENIEGIVNKSKEVNASYLIGWPGMTIREGQREHFYLQLDKHFPGVKEKYIRFFGDNYNCGSPNYNSLIQHFNALKTKLNISDRPSFYNPPRTEQLKLF